MATTMITKDTHPNRDFAAITQVGLKAYNLATEHAPAIEARLPGATAALKVDLEALNVVVPGARLARKEAIVATAAQNALARKGYNHVQAIRKTVRKSGAPKDVQIAYGVGQSTSPTKVPEVKAALQQIVGRATSAPEEAEGFGLVAADVASLNDLIASLSSADMDQDTKRASAPMSTRARNVTANRVLQSAAMIAGTGMRAFADDPMTFALFKALMASTAKPRKSPEKKEADSPDAPPKSVPPAGGGSG